MNKMMAVTMGGGLGALLRYSVQNWAMGRFGAAFPYGTMIVNLSGAFLIGLGMTVFLNHLHIPPVWRIFLVTGILGGYTTFSALTWESYALYTEGRALQSVLYAGGSFLGGMMSLFLGIILGRLI